MNEIIAEINKTLKTSRRKKLSAESISEMVHNLEDSNCFVSWCRANYSAEGKGTTHIGLAVKIGDLIYMGFAEGALQKASPGRAWPELKPWNPSTSTLPEKIRKWALNQKIKIEIKSISSFCELLKKSETATLKEIEKDRNFVIKEEVKIT